MSSQMGDDKASTKCHDGQYGHHIGYENNMCHSRDNSCCRTDPWLQLDIDASLEDIKFRYKKMSVLVHPDKNQGLEQAHEAFLE